MLPDAIPLHTVPLIVGLAMIILGLFMAERTYYRIWSSDWLVSMTLVVLVIGGFFVGVGMTQWELGAGTP